MSAKPGVLIVTGASRGIGAACARLGAAAGYQVVVNFSKHADAAQAVVRDIESSGGRAVAVGADVSQADQVEHLFTETDRHFGPVTALINNAGIGGAIRPIEEHTEQTLDALFRTNIYSCIHCAGAELMRQTAPTIPIGRVGQAQEIAQAAIWLLSPGASYVHGTTIDVSGGR